MIALRKACIILTAAHFSASSHVITSFAQGAAPNTYSGPGCQTGFQRVEGQCVLIGVPENAELNILGNGWKCKRGFQFSGGKCAAIQVPENAQLNVLGDGWICKHGFVNSAGQCTVVQIPANAQLDVLGSGWTCKRGFQLSGGKCVGVQIPENAQLNVLGNGWTCKRGFQNAGGKCTAVQMPENAELNIIGNGWSCKTGFKRAGEDCQKMSPAELAAHEKMMKEILARRSRSIGRGDTHTTSRGAEFSIRVRDADLDCNEGFSGGYDSCEVEISYEVSTNYNGNDSPNVSIRCEAEVSYTDKSGWSNSDSEDESKTIYMYSQTDRGRIDLDFNFYEPAVKVRISEVSCKISSVY